MTKKRLYCIVYLILTFLPFSLKGQEDVMFTNRQLRAAYTNPAYIPEIKYATITLGHRRQWIGVEGAPVSSYVGGKYFFLGAHSQIGLSVLHDKIGYHQYINPKASYACMIPIWDDSYLNLGVAAGLINRDYDKSEIRADNTTGNADYFDDQISGSVPDVDVGLELLIQGFELGVSGNHLIRSNDYFEVKPLYSGYINYYFQTSEWWRLFPSISVYNYRDRWKTQISCYFYYIFDYEWNPYDLFYVGAAFRPNYDVSVHLGVNPTSWFNIFYSYEFNTSDLYHDTHGSHEIGIEFKIPYKFQGCFANYGKSKKYSRYKRYR